jgi:hypothetical protein
VPPEVLPVARPSDRALARALALRSEGRHAEALRVLDAVDEADGQRAAADALRALIQQDVLAAVEGRHEAPLARPEGAR